MATLTGKFVKVSRGVEIGYAPNSPKAGKTYTGTTIVLETIDSITKTPKYETKAIADAALGFNIELSQDLDHLESVKPDTLVSVITEQKQDKAGRTFNSIVRVLPAEAGAQVGFKGDRSKPNGGEPFVGNKKEDIIQSPGVETRKVALIAASNVGVNVKEVLAMARIFEAYIVGANKSTISESAKVAEDDEKDNEAGF